jgi:GNAT superfamily N-acetyltransferase
LVRYGWLLRFSEGYTRRANSVNPLHAGQFALLESVRYCEALYTRHGLPTIFRIPSTLDPTLGKVLDWLGYEPPEDGTRVLYMDIPNEALPVPADVSIEKAMPGAPWLSAVGDLHRLGDQARSTHRRILKSLSVPAAFASVPVGDRLAALAFGAVHDGIVCINSVVIDPAFRRMGLASKAISSILGWAQGAAGATGGVCLWWRRTSRR